MTTLLHHHPYLALIRLRDWLTTHPGVYTVTGETMPEDTTTDQQYYNDDILVSANVIYTVPPSPAYNLWTDLFFNEGLLETQERAACSLIFDSDLLNRWISIFIEDEGLLPL